MFAVAGSPMPPLKPNRAVVEPAIGLADYGPADLTLQTPVLLVSAAAADSGLTIYNL